MLSWRKNNVAAISCEVCRWTVEGGHRVRCDKIGAGVLRTGAPYMHAEFDGERGRQMSHFEPPEHTCATASELVRYGDVSRLRIDAEDAVKNVTAPLQLGFLLTPRVD